MKKINKILFILLLISFIVNVVLICYTIKINKETKHNIDVVYSELDNREKDLTEANTKINKLNATVDEMNNQLSELNNIKMYYVEETEEKTMYATEDTYFISMTDDKVGALSRSQGVHVIGVVKEYKDEDTLWYEIKKDDGSLVFVSGKYLADNKPAEIKVNSNGTATVGSGSTAGKSQAQIDFEKKTQELINSGKVDANAHVGGDGVADFSGDGTSSGVELQ